MDDETPPGVNEAYENQCNQYSESGKQIEIEWRKLLRTSLSSRSPTSVKQAAAFVSNLGRAVGFIDSTPASLSELPPLFLCERIVNFLNEIPRALGRSVRVYITAGSQLKDEEYQQLLGHFSKAGLGNRVFIVVVPGAAQAAKDEARRTHSGIIILDSSDIMAISSHAQPPRLFYRLIRQQCPIDMIQPYNHFGAVRPAMFFGRQKELSRIMLNPDKSFAIYGGRRAGKTSLLTRLGDDLKNDTSNMPLFFSSQGIKDIADFSQRMLLSLQGTRVESPALRRRFDLEQLRADLKYQILTTGKRVTFLVDEIDDLVTVDQKRGEPMMNMLRGLNEELREKCRFIFAGFRRLYDRMIYYYSPVMNFLIPMELGAIDKPAARKLVELPFYHYMGYDIEPDVIDMILNYSSLSPWQIQHFCGRLVQSLAEEQRDTVGIFDAQQTFNDYAFRTEVVETVLSNLSNDQMAILCLFLDSDGFTREDVYQTFQKEQLHVDLSFLGRQLDQMVKFGVLSPPRRDHNKFSFQYAHLATIIKEVEAPSQLLFHAKQKIKQRERKPRY